MVPGGVFKKAGGVTVVRTGIPGFNMAFALAGPFSQVEASSCIRRLYSKDKFPWSLITTVATTGPVQPMIRRFGLVKALVEPAMVLSPIPTRCPPLPKGLDVRRVEDRDELLTFARTGAPPFGMAATSMDDIAEGLARRIADGSFRGGCYLGYYGGTPVATSLRFTSSRVAGVYFVATAKKYRGRGIGEAMTWRAAVDGREEGCSLSALQASEMGRPVYEGMGYRTVANYEIWRPSVAESSFSGVSR